MGKLLVFAFLLLTLFSPNAFCSTETTEEEIASLRQIFENEVSVLTVNDENYENLVKEYVAEKMQSSDHANDSQYFVFVDRGAKKQLIAVGFYDPENHKIYIIGWDKVSTGNPERKGYFETPIGIFENSIKNMGYRAEGTRNANGWRGLGRKGSRVWDFGWQKTKKKRKTVKIRLLMHATDPDFGEPRLGTRDSKGCVRVSAKMNKFLDMRGILDKDYEDNPKKARGLLRKDRKTVSHPGRYMIVGEIEPACRPAYR